MTGPAPSLHGRRGPVDLPAAPVQGATRLLQPSGLAGDRGRKGIGSGERPAAKQRQAAHATFPLMRSEGTRREK
jgi:hypothetical protein